MEPVVVEVKGIIKAGFSLFGHMMKTVDNLSPGQGLVVKSTFNPKPLISQMKRRGYTVGQARTGNMIVTTFMPGMVTGQLTEAYPKPWVSFDGPQHFLDNRGLTPPEPMQRTMGLLSEVSVGDVVVIHNDRVPVFLLGQLDDDGIPYETVAQSDDSAIVRILKTHEIAQ